MMERNLHRARIISSIAATAISLACGTNYVYSAWAPQFADKLRLSTTQSELIGVAGNLGMYTMGVPIGWVIDRNGSRPAVMLGSALLGIGYFGLKVAFDQGDGYVPLLFICSYLTGFGGCMAFAASVKTSALNWPHHRGTATSFPLAAFGLSAFFFSMFGEIAFPGDTSAFLLVLAVGTIGLTFVGFFFLKVWPHPNSEHHHHNHAGGSLGESGTPYQSVPGSNSGEQNVVADGEGGVGDNLATHPKTLDTDVPRRGDEEAADETSSLMSRSSTASSLPGEVLVQSIDLDRSHRVDIRGWNLLKNTEFWQLFSIMGILAGIGLMTINNIGHNTNALWKHYDESVSEEFLIGKQQMHVSILSVGSFSGRLLSGVGSDYLVKNLKASRVWCLVISALVFCAAQICALIITNPHFLLFISSLSGLGYGYAFGVFPSIVAESFGIHGLSQNWGFMTFSPVLSGWIFNFFYGQAFDAHSVVGPGGERTCLEGIECYRPAYFFTLGACGLGLLVSLYVIRHQRLQKLREAARGVGGE
ncbi:hypothetical protein MCOR02_002670 [Pyricularia oryzae]|nr:hypothetical protein MCOR02_002670 [Pyricularia oryzae]KAI6455903.1 hypothetical protein MCOR17_008488 [Pyricularia oryzae]KAI6632650.1 hypothetical protein MCOR14_007107 [Pyricularia oryzae]